MTRRVLYVAAPLRPTEEEIAAVVASLAVAGQTSVDHVLTAMQRNIDRAMAWLAWLRRSFPETTFIAPWIVDILSGADDSDPAQREAGMQGNFAVIERCDGIVLCGPRISNGMRREMEHGVAEAADRPCDIPPYGFSVYDLTGYQIEGASGRNEDRRTFEQWMLGYQESCTR